MFRFTLGVLATLLVVPIIAVSKNGFELDGALVPVREIRRGGPPRDGIPAIHRPRFVRASDDAFMKDDYRILGLVVDGVPKAYPVKILDRHEIVNDASTPTAVAVTYCPLCGSGVVFKSDGRHFGVSGLLYNSDVLLYDMETESLWSQLMAQAISGPSRGDVLDVIPALHTTWGKWRELHPDTYVLSHETGFRMDYRRSPYPGYERTSRTVFPVGHRSKLYHAKAWVLGIQHRGVAKAYPFEELAKTDGPLEDVIAGDTLTVYFDEASQSAWIEIDDALLPSVRAFWFAWYAFHPQTEVFTR